MRLPLVARSNLGPEQRELYDDMRQGIESNFKGFEAISSDGGLIGPWNACCITRNSAAQSGSLSKSSPPRRLCRGPFAKSQSSSPARISTPATSFTRMF